MSQLGAWCSSVLGAITTSALGALTCIVAAMLDGLCVLHEADAGIEAAGLRITNTVQCAALGGRFFSIPHSDYYPQQEHNIGRGMLENADVDHDGVCCHGAQCIDNMTPLECTALNGIGGSASRWWGGQTFCDPCFGPCFNASPTYPEIGSLGGIRPCYVQVFGGARYFGCSTYERCINFARPTVTPGANGQFHYIGFPYRNHLNVYYNASHDAEFVASFQPFHSDTYATNGTCIELGCVVSNGIENATVLTRFRTKAECLGVTPHYNFGLRRRWVPGLAGDAVLAAGPAWGRCTKSSTDYAGPTGAGFQRGQMWTKRECDAVAGYWRQYPWLYDPNDLRPCA